MVSNKDITNPFSGASQVALVIKNLPASAEDKSDTGSFPENERSPGGGHGNSLGQEDKFNFSITPP